MASRDSTRRPCRQRSSGGCRLTTLRGVRRRRLVAFLVVLALWPLGLSSPAAADEAQGGTAESAGHVVEPVRAPSVGAVLREVPNDLWRFVSLETAGVLAAGGGAAAIGHIWDDDLVTELQVNTQLNNAFEPGSKYGAFAVMLGGSFTLYAAGRVSRHPHIAVVGADLVRGQIVSQLWVQALKYTVQRERPDHSNNVSFPSGHAAGGFAAAVVLTRHYGWKAGIPAYAGATYIAAARVHDNKHYLSDVIFGAAMGIAGARTVLLRAGRYRVSVAPELSPHRAAVRATFLRRGHE